MLSSAVLFVLVTQVNIIYKFRFKEFFAENNSKKRDIKYQIHLFYRIKILDRFTISISYLVKLKYCVTLG